MRESFAVLRVSSVAKPETGEQCAVPLYLCRVSAGFPSPASDYVERDIDLNDWLIRNRLATYVVRVEGDSMIGEIHPGDRLIVDRSLVPYRWPRRKAKSSTPMMRGAADFATEDCRRRRSSVSGLTERPNCRARRAPASPMTTNT